MLSKCIPCVQTYISTQHTGIYAVQAVPIILGTPENSIPDFMGVISISPSSTISPYPFLLVFILKGIIEEANRRVPSAKPKRISSTTVSKYCLMWDSNLPASEYESDILPTALMMQWLSHMLVGWGGVVQCKFCRKEHLLGFFLWFLQVENQDVNYVKGAVGSQKTACHMYCPSRILLRSWTLRM